MTIERARDRGRRLLGRRDVRSANLLEQRLETARMYAGQLTQSGTRCDRNDGAERFCHWRATQLEEEFDGAPEVAVRCTIHPGGRCLDNRQRLHWSELPED